MGKGWGKGKYLEGTFAVIADIIVIKADLVTSLLLPVLPIYYIKLTDLPVVNNEPNYSIQWPPAENPKSNQAIHPRGVDLGWFVPIFRLCCSFKLFVGILQIFFPYFLLSC